MFVSECMYMHHEHAGANGSQKRLLDLLKLELQVVVRSHVGTGHQTRSFVRAEVFLTAETLSSSSC